MLRKSIIAAAVLAVVTLTCRAEVNEISIARQFGISFLPLMLMEHDKLVEQRVKAAGAGDVKVNWANFAGPSVMNDALISGSLTFASVGVPSVVTLTERTRGSVDVKGIAAYCSYPLSLNTRNPNVKSIKDLTDKDRIAVPSVKVSTQAIVLQMAAEKAFGPGNHGKLDSLTVSLSHPDAMIALLSGKEINAHFATSPFHEEEMKVPGIHTILNSYDVLGGRATAIVLVTSGKFRDANPKIYNAVLQALGDAINAINKDKRAAAQLYIDMTRDKRSTVDDMLKILNDPQFVYTLTPEKVFVTAEFMHKIGMAKVKPNSWKDYFFPEGQALPGN